MNKIVHETKNMTFRNIKKPFYLLIQNQNKKSFILIGTTDTLIHVNFLSTTIQERLCHEREEMAKVQHISKKTIEHKIKVLQVFTCCNDM